MTTDSLSVVMSHSNKVFSIPELVEIGCSCKDLLLQHRVNRTRQRILRNSRPMQRKLHNDVDLLEGDDCPKRRESDDLGKVKWNPFMTSFQNGRIEKCDIIQKLDLEAFKKYDHTTASWKAMYLTRAAFKKAMIFNRHVALDSLVSVTGITIGQLAETQHEGCPLRFEGMMCKDLQVYFMAIKRVRAYWVDLPKVSYWHLGP